mgnify:CR=1 FL=1
MERKVLGVGWPPRELQSIPHKVFGHLASHFGLKRDSFETDVTIRLQLVSAAIVGKKCKIWSKCFVI